MGLDGASGVLSCIYFTSHHHNLKKGWLYIFYAVKILKKTIFYSVFYANALNLSFYIIMSLSKKHFLIGIVGLHSCTSAAPKRDGVNTVNMLGRSLKKISKVHNVRVKGVEGLQQKNIFTGQLHFKGARRGWNLTGYAANRFPMSRLSKQQYMSSEKWGMFGAASTLAALWPLSLSKKKETKSAHPLRGGGSGNTTFLPEHCLPAPACLLHPYWWAS